MKISEYWLFGAKEENYKEYEKLRFIQKFVRASLKRQ
jgi:hypothetical protein